MNAGQHGAQDRRPQAESDGGQALALVMAGAAGGGLLAILTLVSGGGFVAALLVYSFGASALVSLFVAAPHARRIAVAARHRASGPHFSGQPS